METLSIYIPTKDRPDSLDRALYSLTQQTDLNFEVVVCDDYSTVDNLWVREKYSRLLDNFTWINSEQSGGACVARNKAIRASSGSYVTGLDDDDIFEVDRVAKFRAAINNSEGVYYDAPSRRIDGVMYRARIGSPRKIGLSDLKYGNQIGNQVVAPKALILGVGGFDEEFPAMQDYELWFRILLEIDYIERLLGSSYVVNADSSPNSITASKRHMEAHELFRAKHESFLTPFETKWLKFRASSQVDESNAVFECLNRLELDVLTVYLYRNGAQKIKWALHRKIYESRYSDSNGS